MDATSNRTAHMRALVAAAGGPAEWAAKYGGDRWTASQASQWISEKNPKAIGNNLARDLEAAHRISRGTLDLPLQGAPQSQSLHMRPDPQMLAESIAACRRLARRQGWDYDPEVNADVTADAYELRAMLPALPSQADVIDFGQKVAERLAREFGNGEGGPGAGASIGGHDRGAAGADTGARKAGASGRSR